MVDKLISDINKALDGECYFAALVTALTLPDICGKAEYPNDITSKRYKEWCKNYVVPHVKPASPYGDDMPYLSEEVLYSLRNSLLHQGTPDIDIMDIKEFLISELETDIILLMVKLYLLLGRKTQEKVKQFIV